MLESMWQYFMAGLSLYVIAKLIYFCIQVKGPSKSDCNTDVDDFEDDFDFSDDSDNEDGKKLDDGPVTFINLDYRKVPKQQELENSEQFYALMQKRRSVTDFSSEDVSIDVMKNIIKTAGTSPSLGHTEPWKYILIKSSDMKERIREIVEANQNYVARKRRNLGKFVVNKEHLTDAPYLIVVSAQSAYELTCKNKRNCFFEYSTPLSVGILLTAIQYVGLVSLVSTITSCSEQLKELLNRPKNETLILLIAVGYPKEDCQVPDLHRKPVEDICEVI